MWQPIETVPTDQWVLVYGDAVDEGRPVVGVDRLTSVTEEWWETVSDTRKELQSEVRKYWDVYAVDPTHWMPLPELPNA